jgi:hypothetical protein
LALCRRAERQCLAVAGFGRRGIACRQQQIPTQPKRLGLKPSCLCLIRQAPRRGEVLVQAPASQPITCIGASPAVLTSCARASSSCGCGIAATAPIVYPLPLCSDSEGRTVRYRRWVGKAWRAPVIQLAYKILWLGIERCDREGEIVLDAQRLAKKFAVTPAEVVDAIKLCRQYGRLVEIGLWAEDRYKVV